MKTQKYFNSETCWLALSSDFRAEDVTLSTITYFVTCINKWEARVENTIYTLHLGQFYTSYYVVVLKWDF